MKIVHIITDLGDGVPNLHYSKFVNMILKINTLLFHSKVKGNIFHY